MNPENENHEDEISLKEIIAFLKKRMVKILLRGVVSLGWASAAPPSTSKLAPYTKIINPANK